MTGKQMLECVVRRFEYDFTSFTGRLYMEEGNCCDMSACIHFFRAVDHNVIYIVTFSGEELDTSYRIVKGEWRAYPNERGEIE